PIQVAYDVLRSGGDKQFDEALVHEFIRWLGVFPVGTLVELHTGEVALVLEKHEKLHLRPKVVVLRDAHKQPCEARYLDLAQLTVDAEGVRSEEHTSELQSRENLVCRLLLEKKKRKSRRRR